MTGKVGNICKQGSVTFGKVTHIGNPVVLFGIDIQMVVARPAHVTCQVVVEESLQCHRQWRIFTGRRNQQIPSVLEEQSLQAGIFLPVAQQLPAAVYREVIMLVGTQSHRHTGKQWRIILDMSFFHLDKRFCSRLIYRSGTQRLVTVVLEIRTHIGHNHGRIGILHTHRLTV